MDNFSGVVVPITLVAGHRTKKEAKYDLDATFAYRHTRAQEQVALSKFQKDSKRSITTPKEPQPCGQGMARWADKYFAKRLAGGPVQGWSALHASAASPDGYHSAREPSDFDNETEKELQDVESEEEPWSNLTIPTPAQSGLAILHFVASAA